MKNKTNKTMTILTTVIVANLTVLTWFAWDSYDSYRHFYAVETQQIRAEELHGTILYLDEVLTMSARMAAATGDLKWEERYLEFLPKLNTAINEAIALAPDLCYDEAASKTDAANIKLVEMETEAFDLIRHGNSDSAVSILFSNEYKKQKLIYSGGIADFEESLHGFVIAGKEHTARAATMKTVIMFLLTLLLIFTWFIVFRAVRLWGKDITEHNRRLAQLSDELLESNKNLDQKVVERTHELEASKQLAVAAKLAIEKANISLIKEINERKQVEQNIKQLALLATNNPAPVLRTDWDGKINFLNPAAEIMFNQDIIGQSIYSIFVELDDLSGDMEPIDSIYQFEQKLGDETYLFSINKDKAASTIWIYGNNITERKNTEKALIESENRFRTLFNSSSDAIMLLEEKGFVDCNTATLKLFGYQTVEEFCTKHPSDLSPPTQPCGTDSMALANERIATAAKKGSNHFEWLHQRIDGVSFYAEVLLTAMHLDKKKMILATVRDITERKRAEEDQKRLTELLINSNDKLEDALKNRELAEEVLNQKSIELEERVRELTCMYKMADIIDKCESLEQIFHSVVKIIPSAWKYPEMARAKIRIYGQEYVSEAFEETEWKLTGDISVSGEVKGFLEVYYLKKCPNQNEEPFLQDERNLINNITQTLGKAVEREKARETKIVLSRISDAAFSTKDLEEMLKIIHNNLSIIIDTSNFYVALYDAKTELYSFPFHVDEYDNVTDVASLDLKKSLTDYVRKTAGPLLIDKKAHQRLADRGEVEILGTPAEVWLGAPLTLGDNIIGTVAVQSYTDPQAFTRNDLDILMFVSEHIAMAIERKRAEEVLSQTIGRYTAMINTVPALMFIKDTEDKYIEVNEAFCRFVGRSKGEIIGKDTREVHSKELAVKFYAEDKFVMENDQEFINQEKQYNDYDGNIKWISSSRSPLHDSNGKVCGLVGLSQDVTEQHLSRQHLLQSDKLAGIGQLAAGVAHEINNPVGYINSNLNTMAKYLKKVNEYFEAQDEHTPEDMDDLKEMLEDFTDAVNESMEGTNKVKQIVSDLKSFSRVDRAEKELTSINDGIDSTLNVVRNEIKYKAKVKKEYGEIPELFCIPNQLNQVFMNLLVNAAQAIEKEMGLITIKTWADEGNIYISIADDGAGIPEKNINRLFEPFYTTKDVGKGTGLGLSLSYDIIKKHRGNIEVKSEVGVGTVFTITLPLGGISEREKESESDRKTEAVTG